MKIFVFTFLLVVQDCYSDIYVGQTPYASVAPTCGIFNHPCRTIELAIDAMGGQFESIVLLNEAQTPNTKKAVVFEIRNTILVDKHIEIKAYYTSSQHPKPIVIAAKNHGVNTAFRFINNTNEQTTHKLSVKSITFDAISLVDFSHDGIVHVEDCHFKNIESSVFIGAFEKRNTVTFDITKSVFTKCASITNIFIRKKSIKLQLTINIQSSSVIGNSENPGDYSGILISAYENISRLSIHVNKTNFSHMAQGIFIHSIQEEGVEFSIINSIFHDNILYIKDMSTDRLPEFVMLCGGGLKYTGKGKVTVNDTDFINNTANKGGAVCMFGPEAVFNRVNFIDNKALENGGACYFLSSKISITNSNFTMNSASGTKFEQSIQNNERDLTGTGGAIQNTYASALTIQNSTFIHNNADVFGGTIHHEGERLIMTHSILVGPADDDDVSLHGSILYSKTRCFLKNNYFSSVSSNGLASVIFHSSDKAELTIKPTFSFSCRTGEKLVRSYNHHPDKTEFSLLMFICKPCHDRFYSLQKEIISMNASGIENDSTINCKPCPQGGVCEHGIRSLPNFWGWHTKNGLEVKFINCPSSTYCCTDKTCNSYDSCSFNREGRLCGKCIKGYAESLFASVCVPNESCGSLFLWPFFVITGFCYVFVLMYLKDIFSFIKLLILKPVSLIRRLKSTSQSSDIDDFDHFYVVFSDNENGSINETVIQHQIPETIKCESTDNDGHVDEASIMSTGDEEDSVEFLESGEYASIAHEDYFDHDMRERLITGETTITTPAKRKKIKWYSYLFGIFKILVFFYQMQLLSKVPSVLEYSYGFEGPRFLKEFVTGIFNLKLTGSFFVVNFCVIENLDPIGKRYTKIGFVLMLFVILLLFSIIWKLAAKVKKLCSNKRESENDKVQQQKKRLPFLIRVKCCTLQLLLLGYSTISTATFELIHCVRIDDFAGEKDYSYINATEECKGPWYTFAIYFVTCWTIPFFIALFGANKLLREEKIFVNEFLLILFFPPLLLYFLARNICNGFKAIEADEAEMQTRDHVLQVLEMPFQKKSASKSAWYWETMLIFRRLILVCTFVFLPEPISRLYVMCIPLTLFLVDHLRVQPYNSRILNWFETASLLLLVFLISINLFWAYNYETNVPITESLSLISHTFLYVETFILLLPLIILLCIVIAAIIRRVIRRLRR